MTTRSMIFTLKAKIKIQSKGLMLGYKLPIGKRFNIDFLIAGPGTGSHNYKLDQKCRFQTNSIMI